MMEQFKGLQRQKENEEIFHVAENQHPFAGARVCPRCQTKNDSDALYCEECGASLLSSSVCPNCYQPLDADADYCEYCHTYVCKDRCSFCGAEVVEQDAYCPDCGTSRQGILCPVCHTKSYFSYCPVCAIPLTTEAVKQREAAKKEPIWKYLESQIVVLEKLMKKIPVDTERQMERNAANEELCQRVRLLLDGIEEKSPERSSKQETSDDLANEIAHQREELQRLLDSQEVGEQQNPIHTRNYVMAHKPPTTLLGWKCNFKHVVHSSPCGCSCPQMGGKWIVLNGDIRIEDDM